MLGLTLHSIGEAHISSRSHVIAASKADQLAATLATADEGSENDGEEDEQDDEEPVEPVLE